MKKRGELEVSSIIELIVAVAGISLIIYLSVALLAPGYDTDKEIAKSYFERLEGELEAADSGDVGEFFIFDREGLDVQFYLTYFKSVAEFDFEGKHFSSSKAGGEILCVCYGSKDSIICKNCISSKLPFVFDENSSEMQVFGEGVRFEIFKKGDYYEFSSK